MFVSDDNWQTVFLQVSPGVLEQVIGKEADLVRFLAVSQSSWQGNAS